MLPQVLTLRNDLADLTEELDTCRTELSAGGSQSAQMLSELSAAEVHACMAAAGSSTEAYACRPKPA